MSKLTNEYQLQLEEPLIRVPFEQLKRQFKSSQKIIEKETHHLNIDLKQLTKSLSESNNQQEYNENLLKISNLINIAKNLKNNLLNLSKESKESINTIDKRFKYLKTIELIDSNSLNDLTFGELHMDFKRRKLDDNLNEIDDKINFNINLNLNPTIDNNLNSNDNNKLKQNQFDSWNRSRLSRMIIDYLLRNGSIKSAKLLIDNENLSPFIDYEIMEKCLNIKDSLILQKSTKLCLKWCLDNKLFLKKISITNNNSLEFEIRVQQFVELIEIEKIKEAKDYYQNYLIKFYTTKWEILKFCSALLVFNPSSINELSSDSMKESDNYPLLLTNFTKYKSYFTDERYKDLATLFVETLKDVYKLPKDPLLLVALSAGVTALKTKSCKQPTINKSLSDIQIDGKIDIDYENENDNENENDEDNEPVYESKARNCPICSPDLNCLSYNLPYSQHFRSHIDEDPVLLPNGKIYGKKVLVDLANKLQLRPNVFKDPADLTAEYTINQLMTVFPV